MKLLIVEDDAELVHELRPILKKAGFVLDVADNGMDGEFLGLEESFDAIVLDLGLPGKEGIEVLRTWRSVGLATPVLILTARDAWFERVDGLRAGADDYLGKPFHPGELIARLEAIIRRNAGKSDNTLEWAGVTLDVERQIACQQDGSTRELTGIEFRLLRYLMLHPQRVLSKTELSEHVYEEEQLKDSNVIEVYINRLRHLFGKDFIETRRRQGYRLRAPER
ncbi:MAG: DNA-binding response regulator [marine bacterium B5-7]|nr:MAG: DNA-binding response regulator [marine bacterium B5-7]